MAAKVYRGLSGMALPRDFHQKNAFGVAGGVEAAFMSTTTSREVAMGYAGGGRNGIVFEVQMGMVDRGADIAWLSQYPHEKEILFAPLSGLEVQSSRVDGSVLAREMGGGACSVPVSSPLQPLSRCSRCGSASTSRRSPSSKSSRSGARLFMARERDTARRGGQTRGG